MSSRCGHEYEPGKFEVLREAKELIQHVAGPEATHKMARMIQENSLVREKTSTSVDLPFDEDAKSALNFALKEADQAGDKAIEPKHILIGLLERQDCLAHRILCKIGVTLDSIRSFAETRSKNKFPLVRQSQEFNDLVSRANEEAGILNAEFVRPEHVLLALIRQDSLASKTLKEAGLSYEAIREKLERA